MTILLTPFMSCSAKLPIYSLFAAAFFPDYAGLVMVLLYFGGIVVGVLAALLLKSTVFPGRGGALCDGAAQLPSARPEKRGPAAVGKGPRLPAEGLYGHLCGHHRHLVPAEL